MRPSTLPTTVPPTSSAPRGNIASSVSGSRPSSSPRKSPKWPCSLDLPDTTSRTPGVWPQHPLPAGPGAQAGGSDEDERVGTKRVTFQDPEEAGPADHEPQHGAAGDDRVLGVPSVMVFVRVVSRCRATGPVEPTFEASGLHPALRRAAESNSSFGKALRQEISR